MNKEEKDNAFIITVTLSILLLLLVLFYIVSSKLNVIRVIDSYDIGIIEQSPEPEIDKNDKPDTNNNQSNTNNQTNKNEKENVIDGAENTIINENPENTITNTTDNDETTTPENPEPPKKEEIVITSGNINWEKDTKLNLFQNYEIGNKEVIWPGLEGKYEINVVNALKLDARYTIKFKETNEDNLNMKYKLKRNGQYLVSQWTSIEDISSSIDLLKANDTDIYVLEWKWIEEDEHIDTEKQGKAYKVEISIYSEQI